MKIINKLENLGWKKFDGSFLYPHAKCSYQFCQRDEDDNKMFFVNCALYDFSYISNAPQSIKEDLQPSFDAQFTLPDDETFNVEYSGKSIEKALTFFLDMWNNMSCKMYQE